MKTAVVSYIWEDTLHCCEHGEVIRFQLRHKIPKGILKEKVVSYLKEAHRNKFTGETAFRRIVWVSIE